MILNENNSQVIWLCPGCRDQAHGLEGGHRSCRDCSHGAVLNLIGPTDEILPGMREEEHGEHCTAEDRAEGCDCTWRPFSDSSCDGCGCTLAGEREAFTLYWEDTEES